MFTGIIEEIGTIGSMSGSDKAIEMTIHASNVLEDVKLGDSISVNGVCLTVTKFTSSSFTVDVMPETVKATSLNALKQGSNVNLERAMAAGGRFGGHFVTGHVDGTGTIIRKRPSANAVYYDIKASRDLTSSLVMKGSIAIDGISLTIFGLENELVTVSIIPHTLSETVLGGKEAGDIVNIECDMLGKYVKKFIDQSQGSSSITPDFLKENGFY
ncbi:MULTISPECIES: riboflavin synthase [Metabacillus]|uniref:riboflavin synthase n=1 Tax=Metabacillus TaxID=2675233 RepID=UPI0004931E4D|nr:MULTISPECIES: riboflavin synthase [Metabacillus]KEZ50790.1 riboflavin synthase subunit alpha [Metabacillus indicus LMG 22858]MDX8290728.1 riboflavin synthase [Metabacillus indicus]